MSERADRINELARKQKTVGLTPEEEAEQKKLREEFRAAFRANFQKQLDNTYIETPDGEKRKLKKEEKKTGQNDRIPVVFSIVRRNCDFAPISRFFARNVLLFLLPCFCIKKSGEKIRHRKAWASGLLQSAVGRAFPLPFAKNAQNRLT